MWSPPLTIRPVLLIIGPTHSAHIVSGDTIFEQGLVAAPTATVRPAHVDAAFVVRSPCPPQHSAGNDVVADDSAVDSAGIENKFR
jgi:hypothetical protein